jgi:hypothetical protein
MNGLFKLLGLALCASSASLASDAGGSEKGVTGITAVSSRITKDYARVKLPDGSIQPETYAFGEGGNWGGEIKDATIDNLKFVDVARVIAEPLASQRYIPAKDPSKTKLLIMVYWGTTAVPLPYDEDPIYQQFQQDVREYRILLDSGYPEEADAVYNAGLIQLAMANRIRDRLDFKNAAMLGYNTESSALIATDYGEHIGHTPLGIDQHDQVAEIEENRYFVVLMAYDFQLMWKQKKHKELWETRFSISERRNAFDKALPFMAQYASRYFGQASNGILRTRFQEGHVEIGELKSLGEVPTKPSADIAQPSSKP